MDSLALQKIADLAKEAVIIAWRAQGHELTGNAVRELETRIIQTSTLSIIDGLVVDYMVPNNTGVTAARIPYSPGSGAKTSKYIEGLIRYAKQRMGASDKEAKGIAFAIASRHKKEGMPTVASAKFSSTGKRTGFIEAALDSKQAEFEQIINDAIEEAITVTIDNYYKSVLQR
jgi:hypothetical protein